MAIPANLRQALVLNQLFEWYEDTVLPGRIADLSLERCAFMCTEFDPHLCHRHKIANCLELMGFKVLDL